MTQIDAVFESGVFRPSEEVKLPDNQRVRLSVETVGAEDAEVWIQRVRARRERLRQEKGLFPDSTLDIAEDRQR